MACRGLLRECRSTRLGRLRARSPPQCDLLRLNALPCDPPSARRAPLDRPSGRRWLSCAAPSWTGLCAPFPAFPSAGSWPSRSPLGGRSCAIFASPRGPSRSLSRLARSPRGLPARRARPTPPAGIRAVVTQAASHKPWCDLKRHPAHMQIQDLEANKGHTPNYQEWCRALRFELPVALEASVLG